MKGIRSLSLPASIFIDTLEFKPIDVNISNSKNYIYLDLMYPYSAKHDYTSLFIRVDDEVLFTSGGNFMRLILNDYFGLLVSSQSVTGQPFPVPDSGQPKSILASNQDSIIFAAQQIDKQGQFGFLNHYYPNFQFAYAPPGSIDLRNLDLSNLGNIFVFRGSEDFSEFSFMVPPDKILLYLTGDGIYEADIYGFTDILWFEHYGSSVAIGVLPQSQFPDYTEQVDLYPSVMIGSRDFGGYAGILTIYGLGYGADFYNKKYYYYDNNTHEQYWFESFDNMSVEKIEVRPDGYNIVGDKIFDVDRVISVREHESRELALVNTSQHYDFWFVPHNPSIPVRYKNHLGKLSDLIVLSQENVIKDMFNVVVFYDLTPVFGAFYMRDGYADLEPDNYYLDLSSSYALYISFVIHVDDISDMFNNLGNKYVVFSKGGMFEVALYAEQDTNTGDKYLRPSIRLHADGSLQGWADLPIDDANIRILANDFYFVNISVFLNSSFKGQSNGNGYVDYYIKSLVSGSSGNAQVNYPYNEIDNAVGYSKISASAFNSGETGALDNGDFYLYYISVGRSGYGNLDNFADVLKRSLFKDNSIDNYGNANIGGGGTGI